MSTPYGNPREEAEAALQARGFTDFDGEWYGVLRVAGSTIYIRAKLPKDFPTSLPEVYVSREELHKQIAHVEKSGKVCIAPSTGYLLDTANPSGIVNEALDRAARVLDDGLTDHSVGDLQTEFLAYWNSGAEGILSICNVYDGARQLSLVGLTPGQGTIPSKRASLLADSADEAERWIRNLHGGVAASNTAFFVPFITGFRPPDFDEQISTAQARGLIRDHASPEAKDAFEAWLKTTNLPVTVIFSLPLVEGEGRALAGLRFESLTGQAQKKARNGFRPGKSSASVELIFAGPSPCKRLTPDRFDPDFLLPRGGTSIELKTKSVAIIGCGAVGSYVVQQLAAAGVGEFRLVDHEDLINGNCHRHVLGVKYVGTKKVRGIAEEFSETYPHQTYLVKEQKVQDVLAAEPDFVLKANLVVVAVGDETLALSLNRTLSAKRQIHAWLDPMGLGGHVLCTGDHRGCFECLFKRDPEYGLYNAASFAAPGQSFQKSFAGCAGVFTPFGALDANRIAGIASRHTVNMLLQKEERNLLISWLGERQAFEQNGFRVSRRAQVFAVGEERIETGFFADGCPVCGAGG